MSDDRKRAENIADKDLDDAKGGYSVWIGGSLQDQPHTIKSEYQLADTPTLARGNPDELKGGRGHDHMQYKTDD